MSKKNIALIVSVLIVLVTLMFVSLENKEQAKINEQNKILETEKRLQEKKAENRKNIKDEERRTLDRFMELERLYNKSTSFWNDDEESLKEIRQRLRLLGDQLHYSDRYKTRIDRLIRECNEKIK